MSMLPFDFIKGNSLAENFFRRTPILYQQLTDFFQAMQKCDAQGRKQMQRQRLAEILPAARRTPYYRGVSSSDAIAEWPVLAKERLRENSKSLSVQTITSAPAATGGTTGIPLSLRRSWRAVVAEQVALDLIVKEAGIDTATAKTAVLRGDTIKTSGDNTPPFWVEKGGGRRMVFSSNHLSPKTIAAYIEHLRRFEPNVLCVYPSSLEALCGLIGTAAVKIPSLKLILSSSEVLRSDVRQRAAMTLSASAIVVDLYGQAERVSMAVGTSAENFFFQPAYGVTELRFAHNDANHDYYEIQGTSLWNTAQFLVRYQTGDLAILPRAATAQDVESVALGLKPFFGIAGRSSEYIETPDGERIIGINQIPRGLSGVIQMQLVQRRKNRVDIYVVPEKDLSPSLKDRIIKQARSKIPPSVELGLHQVDRIQRTKSGKAPLLVRDIA